MNGREIITDADAVLMNDFLVEHDQFNDAARKIAEERAFLLEKIREMGDVALRTLCVRDERPLIERAAFSAALNDPDVPVNIRDLTTRINDAWKLLRTIDYVTSQEYAPILAFTACRATRRSTQTVELLSYSCRPSDGTGLVIEERKLGSGRRYIHDVTIGEVPLHDNGHARPFGHNNPYGPIFHKSTPRRIIGWAAGADRASADLANPPSHGPVSRVLFGHDEIYSFFQKCQPSTQLDTLFGHVAIMGHDFRD